MKMPSKTLLVFPFALEARPLLSQFPWKAKEGHWSFSTPSGDFDLIICGQGKVNCAVEITDWGHRLGSTEVILCGSAGNLNLKTESLEQSLFVSKKIIEGDFKSFRSTRFPNWSSDDEFRQKTIEQSVIKMQEAFHLSQDADVDGLEERKRLSEKYECNLITWEGAGLVKAANKLGIPWIEIRFVADSESLPSPKEFKKAVLAGGELFVSWFKGVIDVD